jgi:hypothetical protein
MARTPERALGTVYCYLHLGREVTSVAVDELEGL